MKKIVTAILAAVLTLTAGFSVFAASSDSFAIEYDSNTEMHYIPASVAQQANAGDRFLIYCMNNQLHWPHSTPSYTAPNYTEGYDIRSYFESTEKYNEFLKKLQTILYAGYPYNGFGLYQIVANSSSISEAEFNQMLAVPAVLRSDFKDVLGDTQFTYSDYTKNNTENLNKLKAFMKAVGDYYPSSTNTTHLKTPSGLSYQDITALPFYKAALCIEYANGQTPLEVYANFYANSYYVIEDQAYQATQRAVWRLMNEYGIPDNNLTASSQAYTDYPLAGILYQASDANSEILRTEPSSEKISISGDATLTYDKDTKQWVSGELTVTEPSDYNGSYQLSANGDGVSVQTANGGTTVKAGETFKLVADKQVSGSVTATAADKVWLKSMQMYSPIGSQDFQHMVGAVMGKKTIATAKAFKSNPKEEETTTTDPKDPEDNTTPEDLKDNTTTEDPKDNTTIENPKDSNQSTALQTAPAQKKMDGKSITAVLTGDDTNWTKYADWMALAAMVGAAAIIIHKKTSVK